MWKRKINKGKTIKSSKTTDIDQKENDKVTREQSRTGNKDTRKFQFKDTYETNKTSKQKEKGHKQNEKNKLKQ